MNKNNSGVLKATGYILYIGAAGFIGLIMISLIVLVLDMRHTSKTIPDHDTPVYLCHTYATWNPHNYAEFTVQRNGKTIACLLAGPQQS